MLMATGLLYDTSKLVLVDEVDSGLHHSVMSPFWESALYLANKHDKQLFCTTHSEEMLRATLSGLRGAQDSLRVFRVDRGAGDQIEVKRFDYKRLELAEKSGVDIR
jgi:AAA15 family ATPase/GTPase